MKWAFQIKDKMKAAAVLAVILLVIISGNFFMRERFSSLDKTMESMLDDRLKPSAYIYEISNHLYEKRLAAAGVGDEAKAAAARTEHDKAINTLIAQYEKTYLTKDEEKQWLNFKNNLAEYNMLEGRTDVSNAATAEEFEQLLGDLHALSKIQLREGSDLRIDTKTIVSNTMMVSVLEISLLTVLGLFTLVIISTSDRRIFRQYQKDIKLN